MVFLTLCTQFTCSSDKFNYPKNLHNERKLRHTLACMTFLCIIDDMLLGEVEIMAEVINISAICSVKVLVIINSYGVRL